MVEQTFSYTANGSLNWCNLFKKQFKPLKMFIPVDPDLEIYPKELSNVNKNVFA